MIADSKKHKAKLYYFSKSDKICDYLVEIGIDSEIFENGDELKIDNIASNDILIFNYSQGNVLLSKYLKMLHSHAYMTRIMIFAVIDDINNLIDLYPNFDYLVKDAHFCKYNLKIIQNKLNFLSSQQSLFNLKNFNDDLRTRNETFRTVLNSSPDAIIMVRKDGTIIGSNDYIQNTMIKQLNSYSGKNIFDLISIGLSSLLRMNMDKAHNTGENQVFAFKHYDFVTEYKIVPVVESDTIDKFIIFTQNITEKVYAERALKFNTELLAAVVNNLPVMVWHIESNSEVVLVSGRLSQTNSPLNLIYTGGNLNELLPAYPDFLHNIDNALKGKINYSLDQLDSYFFETYYSVIKDEIGNISGVIGLSNDITDKINSELKLEEERKKVKFAFNVSYDSFWELDLVNKYLSINSLDIKKDQLPIPSQISIDDFIEMIYPEDQPYFKKLISSFADASITSTEFHYRIKGADGNWTWIESKASIFGYDEINWKPLKIIGVARDVTDKINIEMEIQRSRNLLETIINSGEHYFMLFDSEMNLMAYNNLSFDHLLSYLNIYLHKGLKFNTLFSDRPAGLTFTEHFLSALSGNSSKYEFNYIDYIGSDYWIEHFFDPIKSLDGDIYAVNVIAKPINERKLIEQELINYRNTLEAILDTSPIGIVLLKNEKIQWSNRFWRDMMEYSENDIEEKSFCDFCESTFSCNDCISDSASTKSFYGFGQELQMKTLNANILECLVYTKIVKESAYEKEILITIVDITERKNEQIQRENLLEANIEAEKKQNEAIQLIENSARIASIGLIAGGITHEINQPLNAIRIAAEGILFWNKNNNMALPEQVTRLINKISNATMKVDDIIQHMRAYWVESAKNTSSKVNLNESLKKALSLTIQRVQSHEIFLKIEETVSPLIVEANPLQLEIIINNLVINALQSLDKSERQDKTIVIRTGISDSKPYLKVIDNGIGLPDVPIDDLFDPFFSTKKEEKGTGLGLAIVKLFANRFGASVYAENNKESGATFVVSFQVL